MQCPDTWTSLALHDYDGLGSAPSQCEGQDIDWY